MELLGLDRFGDPIEDHIAHDALEKGLAGSFVGGENKKSELSTGLSAIGIFIYQLSMCAFVLFTWP